MEERIRKVLFSYFAGKASEKEAKEILEWMYTCKNTKNAYNKLADWWTILYVPLLIESTEQSFRRCIEKIFSDSDPFDDPLNERET